MLLGDLRLTANVFSKLSVVPDLVVVNACHLGRVAHRAPIRSPQASGGLCSGSGCAPSSSPAGLSTTTPPRCSRRSSTRSCSTAPTSVGRFDPPAARHGISARSSLTWGAYQCYGDPGFSLTSKLATASHDYVHTTGELRRRLQRLRARASDQGRSVLTDSSSTRQDIRDELTRLRHAANKIGAPPEVLAEFADVWAELLELPSAVRNYRRAIAGGGSEVPIRALEQMANLASRCAQQLHRKQPKGRWDACLSERYAKRAETGLDAAMTVGHTGERWALLGGHHKRMATMTEADARAQHLRTAVSCYHRAQRLQPKAYHEQNWIQLSQVAALAGVELADGDVWSPKPGEQAPHDTGRSDRATLLPEVAPDFWTRAAVGDRLVTEQLVAAAAAGRGGTLPEDAGALISDAYLKAFRLRSSGRERDSVLSHLRDLCDLLPAGSIAAARFTCALDVLSSWSVLATPPVSVGS